MNDVVFNLMYQNLIKFQYHQEKNRKLVGDYLFQRIDFTCSRSFYNPFSGSKF